MRNFRHGVVLLLMLLVASLAYGCSCANSTPIQKTSKKYSERAVFTARVVSLFGTIYNRDGRRSSSLAMAVVKERHWGLPRSWPNVVLLDGSYPCDIAMTEGEDYLVSGFRSRYGVVYVNGCSRTQPLKTAQVDLRTLDGTHCAGPGGTIIGRLRDWSEMSTKGHPISNTLLTFRNADGREYSTRTDTDGIYELQHLPSGRYHLDSSLSQTRYGRSDEIFIAPEFCTGMDIYVDTYTVSGSLAPGIETYVNVDLIGVPPNSTELRADSIEPDGRFYFNKVPPGEYVLSVTSRASNAGGPVYYPGTRVRSKASRIKVTDRGLGRPLDFDLKTLPLVRIPLIVTGAQSDYEWSVELFDGPNLNSTTWRETGEPAVLFGVPGAQYGIRLWGSAKEPMQHEDCISEIIPISVKAGASPVKIPAPTNCR